MSHCLASMSRWFVGSSSRSRSLPANRIAGQLDPPAFTTGERGDRKVEPVGGRDRDRRRCAGPRSRRRSRPRCGTSLRRRCRRARCAATRRRPCAGAARRAAGSRRRARAPTARARARCRRARCRAATDPATGTRPRRCAATTPCGGRRLAREHLEQRGLADAVATDEADLVAGAQREAMRRSTCTGHPLPPRDRAPGAQMIVAYAARAPGSFTGRVPEPGRIGAPGGPGPAPPPRRRRGTPPRASRAGGRAGRASATRTAGGKRKWCCRYTM